MGLRQRQWARKAKKALVRQLVEQQSHICPECGTELFHFSFDVIDPRKAPKHHKETEWSWRISIYRGQHRIGNLQLVHPGCNSRKGRKLPDEKPPEKIHRALVEKVHGPRRPIFAGVEL